MKKQIISFILLFFLIAPVAVTYIWLQHRKAVVRKEVKWKMIAGIDKKELVFFEFSHTENHQKLKWKHSKEFEFNGEMYDVVKKVITTNTIQYWCWWDHEETKLSKQLSKLLVGVFQHDSKSKEKQDLLYKFYNSIYFQPVFSWFPFMDKNYTNLVNTFGGFYQSKFLIIDSPPPNNYS